MTQQREASKAWPFNAVIEAEYEFVRDPVEDALDWALRSAATAADVLWFTFRKLAPYVLLLAPVVWATHHYLGW